MFKRLGTLNAQYITLMLWMFDFPNVTSKSFFLWGVQVPRAQNQAKEKACCSLITSTNHFARRNPSFKKAVGQEDL